MTEEDIKKFALSLGGAKCDYPFEDDFKTFVMRHSASKKWFGIYISAPVRSLLRDERGEKRETIARFCGGKDNIPVVCLKCEPELSLILQGNFHGVVPASHMTKRHGILVIPGCAGH